MKDELEGRAAVYEAEPDPALKRNKAAALIGCLAGHIQLLPAFKNSNALVPVKDMLIFLHSLEEGSGHPWAKPVNFGGTNRETLAETEVRIWVVLGVWTLIEGGWKANKAYKFLADALTKSGRHPPGKEKSHRTVQRWFRAYRNRTDDRLAIVDRHIENFWRNMPCPHDQTMYDCNTTASGKCDQWSAMAERFASQVLSLPSHRDWFVTGSKNEPLA